MLLLKQFDKYHVSKLSYVKPVILIQILYDNRSVPYIFVLHVILG